VNTVVLLLRYDAHGAMGLVINRPSEVEATSLLPDVEGLEDRQVPVYFGGPVDRGRVLLLLSSESPPAESTRIFGNVHVSSSAKALQEALESSPSGEKLRLYAGYAGWVSGQLDAEVARRGWHVVPAEAEAVFDRAPADVWQRFIDWLSHPWAWRLAPGLGDERRVAVRPAIPR
jgi:putative transcriptional regulator